MKLKQKVLSLFVGMTLAQAAAAELPELAFLPVEKIFSIERGFDTNDSVEIAVAGYLPNTCYKLGKGIAQIDHVQKKIFVNVEGYQRQEGLCLQIITPYLEVIQVGLLKAGRYTVQAVVNNVQSALNVTTATSRDQDDFLYAPIDSVELTNREEESAVPDPTPHQMLTLKGTYPHLLKGCMRVSDVKTYLTSNNILVVQPISTILEDKDCNPSDVDGYNRFTVSRAVHFPIQTKSLIHVRTLNGRAVNQLIDSAND